MKYVIKLTDSQYTGSSIYCIRDCIPPFGKHEFFSEDAVFDTVEEAEEHITTMLESSWYRPDITRKNFELVEVNLYPDLNTGFYYTKDEYERFKNLN